VATRIDIDYDLRMIVAHWKRGTELNNRHSRTTSLAFSSSRRPTNLECLKCLSPVHSRKLELADKHRLQPLAFRARSPTRVISFRHRQ
jgi:hypothetical protein